MTAILRGFPLVLACLALADDPAGAKRLAVRGTHLSIVPHPDFEESAAFPGLESEKHEASVLFMELPTPGVADPVQEFSKAMTAEALLARGVILKARETGKQNGHSTLLLKCEQRKDQQAYVKWVFLMAASEPRLAQIQVTAPAAAFPRIEEHVKAMLASVRWEPKLAAITGGSYYTMTLPDGWKLARQFGALDMYTESGRFPMTPGESAIAVMNLNEKPADFRKLVKAMNLKRNHFTALKELESTFLEIDGFEANISHVSAVEVKDRKPVILQYCYIFLGKTVILIEGTRTDRLSKATFENVCKSWKLKAEGQKKAR